MFQVRGRMSRAPEIGKGLLAGHVAQVGPVPQGLT